MGAEVRTVTNFAMEIVFERDRVRARPLRGPRRKPFEEALTNYVAVASYMNQRQHPGYGLDLLPCREVALLHRSSRARNLVLFSEWESYWSDQPAWDQRRAWKEASALFQLPAVQGARRPRHVRRSDQPASPAELFSLRLPDEVGLGIAELVKAGRLAVPSEAGAAPRGISLVEFDGVLQLRFRYSVVSETARYLALGLPLLLPSKKAGIAFAQSVKASLVAFGLMATIAALVIAPVKWICNGQIVTLGEERIGFTPAAGALIEPRVEWQYGWDRGALERIVAKGRSVLVESERRSARIACGTRAAARWLAATLLAYAAYGAVPETDASSAAAQHAHGG